MGDLMVATRAMWIVVVPVGVVLMAVLALGILGIKPPGRTVSVVTPGGGPIAAPPDGAPAIHRERYKVEAVGFHAVDESGWDFWGSDDIYASWRDPASGYISRTSVYEEVDTGDTRYLNAHQNCILPVDDQPSNHTVPNNVDAQVCSHVGGASGPFEFEIALFVRHDSWGPEFCPSTPWGIGPICDGDDLIDQKMVSFTAAELEAAVPHVGDTYQESVPIRTGCGVPESQNDVGGCMWDNGPDYRFIYQITRLPDQEPALHL